MNTKNPNAKNTTKMANTFKSGMETAAAIAGTRTHAKMSLGVVPIPYFMA
jgi:hypothetical protein